MLMIETNITLSIDDKIQKGKRIDNRFYIDGH